MTGGMGFSLIVAIYWLTYILEGNRNHWRLLHTVPSQSESAEVREELVGEDKALAKKSSNNLLFLLFL